MRAEDGGPSQSQSQFLNLTTSLGESSTSVGQQVPLNFEFLQRIVAYLRSKRICQQRWEVVSTEQLLEMLENKTVASTKEQIGREKEVVLKSKI